jgi:hypothetical protein
MASMDFTYPSAADGAVAPVESDVPADVTATDASDAGNPTVGVEVPTETRTLTDAETVAVEAQLKRPFHEAGYTVPLKKIEEIKSFAEQDTQILADLLAQEFPDEVAEPLIFDSEWTVMPAKVSNDLPKVGDRGYVLQRGGSFMGEPVTLSTVYGEQNVDNNVGWFLRFPEDTSTLGKQIAQLDRRVKDSEVTYHFLPGDFRELLSDRRVRIDSAARGIDTASPLLDKIPGLDRP